jgi:hypothetical protein
MIDLTNLDSFQRFVFAHKHPVCILGRHFPLSPATIKLIPLDSGPLTDGEILSMRALELQFCGVAGWDGQHARLVPVDSTDSGHSIY